MKIGALGSPGDALLFCPSCQLFATPIDVGDGLIECRGCRAKLAVFHEGSKGSAEELAPAERKPASEPRSKPKQVELPKPAPAKREPAKPAATPAETAGDVEDMPDVW